MYSRIDTNKNLSSDAVIMCIDMINDFLLPGEPFVIDAGRDMYSKLNRLLTLAREQNIPVVHGISTDMRGTLLDRWAPIQSGHSLNSGSPGVEIVEELRPKEWNEYEIYLPKPKYSCFYGTNLDVYLRNPPCQGRNTIIITGMATNFCCMTTSIDAFNRDYDVIFVDDLNCTMDSNDGTDASTMHRITIETLKDGFISELVTADELMTRLKTDEAKRSVA